MVFICSTFFLVCFRIWKHTHGWGNRMNSHTWPADFPLYFGSFLGEHDARVGWYMPDNHDDNTYRKFVGS